MREESKMRDVIGSPCAKESTYPREEEGPHEESILEAVRNQSMALIEASADLSHFRSDSGFSPLDADNSVKEGKLREEEDMTFSYVWRGLVDLMNGIIQNINSETECLEYRIFHLNGEEGMASCGKEKHAYTDYVNEVRFVKNELNLSICELEKVAEKLLVGKTGERVGDNSITPNEPNISFSEVWGSMPDFLERSTERIKTSIKLLDGILMKKSFSSELMGQVNPCYNE